METSSGLMILVGVVAMVVGVLVSGVYVYWRRKNGASDNEPAAKIRRSTDAASSGTQKTTDSTQHDQPPNRPHNCEAVMRRIDNVFGEKDDKIVTLLRDAKAAIEKRPAGSASFVEDAESIKRECSAMARRIDTNEANLTKLRKLAESVELTTERLDDRCDEASSKISSLDRGLSDTELLTKQVREECAVTADIAKQTRDDVQSLSKRVDSLQPLDGDDKQHLRNLETKLGEFSDSASVLRGKHAEHGAQIIELRARVDGLEAGGRELRATDTQRQTEHATFKSDLEALGARLSEVAATCAPKALTQNDSRAIELCRLHEKSTRREAERIAALAVKNGNGLISEAMTRPHTFDEFVTNLGSISATWRSAKHFSIPITTYVAVQLLHAMAAHNHELARKICAMCVDSWIEEFQISATILRVYQLVPGTPLDGRKLAAKFLRRIIAKRHENYVEPSKQSAEFNDKVLDSARDHLVCIFTGSQHDAESAAQELRTHAWLGSVLGLRHALEPPRGLMLDETTFVGAQGLLDSERLHRISQHELFAVARQMAEWLHASTESSSTRPPIARPSAALERLSRTIRHQHMSLSEAQTLQLMPVPESTLSADATPSPRFSACKESPMGVRVLPVYAYGRSFDEQTAVTLRMLSDLWPVYVAPLPPPVAAGSSPAPATNVVRIIDVQRIVQSRLPQRSSGGATEHKLHADFGLVESPEHASRTLDANATIRARRAESFVMMRDDTLYAYQTYEVDEFGAYSVREFVIAEARAGGNCVYQILVSNTGTTPIKYYGQTEQSIEAGKSGYFVTQITAGVGTAIVVNQQTSDVLHFPLDLSQYTTQRAGGDISDDGSGWMMHDSSGQPQIWVPRDARKMCSERVLRGNHLGPKYDFELNSADNQWWLAENKPAPASAPLGSDTPDGKSAPASATPAALGAAATADGKSAPASATPAVLGAATADGKSAPASATPAVLGLDTTDGKSAPAALGTATPDGKSAPESAAPGAATPDSKSTPANGAPAAPETANAAAADSPLAPTDNKSAPNSAATSAVAPATGTSTNPPSSAPTPAADTAPANGTSANPPSSAPIADTATAPATDTPPANGKSAPATDAATGKSAPAAETNGKSAPVADTTTSKPAPIADAQPANGKSAPAANTPSANGKSETAADTATGKSATAAETRSANGKSTADTANGKSAAAGTTTGPASGKSAAATPTRRR